MELGRADDANELYLDLFRENPRDIETLLSLGQICSAVGRPDEANIFYRRVLEIEPRNAGTQETVQSLN